MAAMTEEQLRGMIEANPVLVSEFRGSEKDGGICPCCIDRVVKISKESPEIVRLLFEIIECHRRNNELNAKIDEVTQILRNQLKRNQEQERDAIHRFYELRNGHTISSL